MSKTREIMQAWADYQKAGDFESSVRLLNPDGKWVVMGTTPVSGVYTGPDEVIKKIGSVLANRFKVAPIVTCTEFIVDGDRGFIRAHGHGSGIAGPYNQPYYAFYFRVEGDGIAEFIEFIDTVELSVAAFGKKLVDA